MSDFSIPGVPGASKYDTDTMIEELMKVERVGLDRMETELETVELEKGAWHLVNRGLSRVRDSARALFSFENPFNERISTSSDESILTATASREASLEAAEIEVLQLAGRDRFLSTELSEDFEVPSGSYTFGVGEKTASFTYHGGDLRDFADVVNSRSKDLVAARVVKSSENSQVLLLESLKAGEQNKLQFLDDALGLGLSAGMFTESNGSSKRLSMEPSSFSRLGKPLSEEVIRFDEKIAVLPPDGEARLPITPPVVSGENLFLKISFEVITFPHDYTPPERPIGPDTPVAGAIAYQGIEISNEPSMVLEPDWAPPPPPEKRDDLNIFYLQGSSSTAASGTGATVPLPPIRESGGEQTIEVALTEYLDVLSALQIKNANTHREIHLKEVVIFDPDSRGDYTPVNPIETASNALVELEGIQITRDTNTIEDLLTGVTINLHKTSDEAVKLEVEPDRESIKNAIIEFVGYYDELISELNILTGRNEDIIEEITYLTDDERSKARERLGLLQGDITLMQLKSRLQTMVMNPYSTSAGRELALLDQIGVSTNAVGFGASSVNRTRLRGYLEIDEEKLDQAVESHLTAVKELFGRDNDSDLIVDSGVAFTLDSYLRPYVETGGLVTTRIDTIDGKIARTSRRIETEQEKLERKEQEYKHQFATMEASLNTLEQSSQQIDNFNKNNSSN
jgi:flagellar hook-associated protein 2